MPIFTKDAIGPIVFEIIQRKDDGGSGEGNVKAPFDSLGLDAIRRGVMRNFAKPAGPARYRRNESVK